ncbi:MAG: TonB-dependent receptor [Pseudomonadota bacterium]
MSPINLACRAAALSLLLTQPLVAQAQADDEDKTIDQIIVTGQKVSRDLQDTQDSVEVVTELDLVERNIIDLIDVIERTPNVTTRDGSTFSIRGINSLNVSGGGSSDLATIYIDGSPLPRQASFAGPADIWDVEQLEIYRGPQSTLQGRASLAGAIIVNTADPSFDWTGRARAIYTTEENQRRLGFAVGGPIVDEQLAFRLAAESSKSDGFGTNQTTGGNLNTVNSAIARGKLLYTPQSIPGLEFLLSISREERRTGEEFNSLSVSSPEDARVGFNDFPIQFDTETDIVTLTVNYDINDYWSLVSITGYNEVDYDYLIDTDRSAAPVSTLILDSLNETWTQELQFLFAQESFDAVFGVYLSDAQTPRSFNDGVRALNLENDLNLSGLLIQQFGLDPATAGFVVSQYPNPAFIGTTSNFSQEIETYALFADTEWRINDKWSLYSGFRYDVEQQSNTNDQLVTVRSTLPDPALFPAPLNAVIAGVNNFLIAGAVDASSPGETADSPDFDGFLPKLGIGYKFDDDRSLSFTLNRGYRSGGVGINAARAEAFSFDQEFTWNYEVAFRSTWLNDSLKLNANVFYTDWTDQQVRVQLTDNIFDTEIQNAGASSVRGFEVDSSYALTSDLEVYGSVGYADTNFEEFNVIVSGQLEDFSGNRFAFAPEWTLNAGLTWRRNNWIVNANANYTSESFIRGDREQTDRESDERILVNFRTGWTNDNYGIYLSGQNLLDESYTITQFPNDPAVPGGAVPDFAQFGAPRTFSLIVEAQF